MATTTIASPRLFVSSFTLCFLCVFLRRIPDLYKKKMTFYPEYFMDDFVIKPVSFTVLNELTKFT